MPPCQQVITYQFIAALDKEHQIQPTKQILEAVLALIAVALHQCSAAVLAAVAVVDTAPTQEEVARGP
ncbi:hypothetical protein A9R12_13960 [Aeromonas hydrophila]|nr:hypothetical protein A9R12_13960 [Aeromonas hydrophila]